MRNSEAQRYARWSAVVAGILAVAVAGVYLRNVWLAREAAKKAPPAVPATVEQLSNEFSFSKVEGQQTIYTVRASRATEFKEGSRNLLEDVSIAVHGKNGKRNDTLSTRACEYIATTEKINCAGEVQISLTGTAGPAAKADAIKVITSSVSFDRESGEARTDKPVVFRWPTGEGRAVGVRYNSDDGTLFLENNVELSIANSSPGDSGNGGRDPEKSIHLTGSSMAFHREAHTVRVLGDVHVQQADRELLSENLLLELDSSFHARHLVAGGHPRLRIAEVQGPILLDGDEISASLQPDGSIDSIVATGNVHSSRRSTAGQDDLQAGRVAMNLATRRNLPRLLRADKGVILKSQGATANAGTRLMETDALEIHLGDGSNRGPVRVESINTLTPTRVDWLNVSMVAGKPIQQTMRMAGKQMYLKFDEQNQLQDLRALGDVEVKRKAGDAPEQSTSSRELTASFASANEWSTIDQTGDVRFREGERSGTGDRAHLDRTTNTATLTGSVALTDAMTRTTAQAVTFSQGSNELRADGKVLTTELRTGTLANFAQEPAHISAEHLVADTLRGHAVYSGRGRLWQGQSVIEAETIELDAASHILIAREKVQGVFPQASWNPKAVETPLQTLGRVPKSAGQPKGSVPPLGRVRGGLLTYWEAESRARIEQDARIDSSQGSIQADRIDLFFSAPGVQSVTKQLSRADAAGNVTVRQEDRRGTANRAEYTASEGKFVLSGGTPTLYSSTGDTTTGRQLTFYFADDRIVIDSGEGAKTVTLHPVEK